MASSRLNIKNKNRTLAAVGSVCRAPHKSYLKRDDKLRVVQSTFVLVATMANLLRVCFDVVDAKIKCASPDPYLGVEAARAVTSKAQAAMADPYSGVGVVLSTLFVLAAGTILFRAVRQMKNNKIARMNGYNPKNGWKEIFDVFGEPKPNRGASLTSNGLSKLVCSKQ